MRKYSPGAVGMGGAKESSERPVSKTLFCRRPFIVTPFRNILMGPDLGHHRNTALSQGNLQGAERDK